jgi:hypothetical protein
MENSGITCKGREMTKMSSDLAHQSAINLIEEQLQALPISVAGILHPSASDAVSADLLESLTTLQNTRRAHDTGSGGNIVANAAQEGHALNFRASSHTLLNNPLQRTASLRVVIGNALLAVGMFFKAHDMAQMRTPEVQFLDHVCDAILNANRFNLEPGYMPIATFDGLVIDGSLNGALLFGDGAQAGIMEFGDAIALLQWLSRYLRGERNFVTGGDAG